MDDSSRMMGERDLILKQSLYPLLPTVVLLPIVLGLFVGNITLNVPLSVGVGVVIAFAELVYFYLTETILYLSSEGMTIKSRLREIHIFWSDVVSMATISRFTNRLEYQIKTSKGAVVFSVPRQWAKFEEFVQVHAQLEIERKAWISRFVVWGPGLKRWRKIGGVYQHTGFFDLLEEPNFFLLGTLRRGGRVVGPTLFFAFVFLFVLFVVFVLWATFR